VIEAVIASESLPDLVGAYCNGLLTPKASPPDSPNNDFRGVSIYRIQNGKMVQTRHVTDSLPSST